jgi:hypothetical protein
MPKRQEPMSMDDIKPTRRPTVDWSSIKLGRRTDTEQKSLAE